MRIAVLPDDLGACGHFRLIWPSVAVSDARPEWSVERYKPGSIKIGRSPRGIVIKGVDPKGLDLVVMQRIGTPTQVELVAALQKNGIAVVIDIDDALHAIPKDNGSWTYWNRSASHHWSHLDEACKKADLVTVTTDALAQRYGRKHGRVQKLVNGLPEAAFSSGSPYQSPEDPRVVIVGWSGVQASHAGDLSAAGDSLRRVLDEDPDVFVKIVGNHEWAADVLGVPQDRLLPESGPVPLHEYHEALQGTDVAIVPLVDNPFNRAKSALKALEYQAAGARVIASPTPANRELRKRAGFEVADTPQEWHEQLTKAIANVRKDHHENPEYRKPLIQRVQPLGIANRAEEWADAWERAVNRRKNIS